MLEEIKVKSYDIKLGMISEAKHYDKIDEKYRICTSHFRPPCVILDTLFCHIYL